MPLALAITVAPSFSVASRQAAVSVVGSSAARQLHSSAPNAAAKKAPAKTALKKKTTVKRKGTATGPRGGGGKRKGGSDSASLSRANPFLSSPVDLGSTLKLQPFRPERCTDINVGKALLWPRETLDAIKAAGLPKSVAEELQTHHTPYTLLRPQTLKLLEKLDGSAPSSTLLTGAKGMGKSTLLLQAVAYALESSSLVPVYVPSCISLVNSTSPYVYSPTQRTYLQPELASSLLNALAKINGSKLKGFATNFEVLGGSQAVENGTRPAGNGEVDLAELLKHALAPTTSAAAKQQCLEILLLNLAAGGKGSASEHRLVLALDDVQALFRASSYRDPDYRVLTAHDLAIPRLLLRILRGKATGASGKDTAGRALHLISSVGLSATEWSIPAEFGRALVEKHKGEIEDAYQKLDELRLEQARDYLGWTDVVEAEPIGAGEAKSLFEARRSEKGLWSVANDELFLLKLIESGGNVRTFDRSLVGTTL